MLTFLLYCALESTAGIWSATYLVQGRGVNATLAASWSALFYLGMTVGRFAAGMIASRVPDRRIIWLGATVLLFGIAALLVPAAPQSGVRIGLLLIGLGCAPIYPTIIHETPQNFGVTNLQAVIGLQMATAYVGSTLAPPLFGVLSSSFGVASYLVFLLSFAGLMMVVLLWRNHQLG